MRVTASQLRENIYRILDEAISTGAPGRGNPQRNCVANCARAARLKAEPPKEAKRFPWESRRRDWDGLAEGVDGAQVEKLSAPARKTIDAEDLFASPAAVLELELLHEIGRLDPRATKLIAVFEEDLGLRICELPFRTVVRHALKENWGRDSFDRLIVGNAKANDATLATKDEKIRQHYPRAIW
jgi:PIN domain nuclease of toxin-antitoxin system